VNQSHSHSIRELLVRWKAGYREALEAPFPLVCLAVASRLTRQILVDCARSHGAAKRGADRKVDLDISLVLPKCGAPV
jgi:hypothetical protein